MTNYFEGSIDELQKRNPGIDGRFRRIDANRFTAVVYREGKAISRCSVFLGGLGSQGIAYSNSDLSSGGGFNESLEISENSELIKRLRRFGRYRFIGNTCATTSMRRYERRGVRRMAWLWTRLWFESWFRDLRHRKYEIVR